MPSISSERVSWNRRASAASFAAYDVGADARRLEPPAARDHEAARQHLVARRLVDRVALAGEQRLVDLEPVGGRAPRRRTGSGRRRAARAGRRAPPLRPRPRRTAPSRTTRATGAFEHREPVERALRAHLLDDADQRSWRRARGRTRPSWIGPTTRMTASIVPRIALKRVKTLARTISPSVRLVRSPVSFTAPRATRSGTSAAVEAGRRCLVRRRWRAAESPGATGALTASGVDTDEGDLAGGVVFEHAEATELGQALAPFVGADRDQLVAGLEPHRATRAVDVAARPRRIASR